MQVISVDRSTGLYASGGAIVGSTAYDISFDDCGYLKGLTLKFDIMLYSAESFHHMTYDDCILDCLGTSGIAGYFAGAGQTTLFVDSTFKFAGIGNNWLIAYGASNVVLRNCSIDAAGSVPTYLFDISGDGGKVVIEDCDLSHITT
jgi:hypothetical protein